MVLITDFDGVFSSPNFTYTKEGKVAKQFSPNDGIIFKIILDNLEYFGLEDVIIITGEDKDEGVNVTTKRCKDIGIYEKINFVSGKNKYSWIKERYDMGEVIYFGDDLYDINIFEECFYSCTPLHSPIIIKDECSYVSGYKGGEDSFTDMSIHIIKNVLNKDIKKIINKEKYNEVKP